MPFCILLDRTSKPLVGVRQEYSDYDDADAAAGEDQNLVTGEEQLSELQNVRYRP